MGKNILLRLACIIAALSLSAPVFAQSGLDGKTVLFVYGGWEGHDPCGCRDLFVPWMESEGATVILSDSLGVYKNTKLMSDIDAIVQLWTMGEISGDEEKGLLDAVKNGTGLAGWHGGLGDSFRNSTEYQFMVGGQWVAHPGDKVHYDVNIADRNDPVMEGLEDFHFESEQYYMHVDPNVKVLATTRFNGDNADWIDGCVMPVVWKKMYGKGRVFYSSLGHDAADFGVPEAFEIMKRGIRWAATGKYEKTEPLVRPIYKKDDLSERIGVCTSIANDSIVRRAGGAYIEISINGFLMPDKPDADFEANYRIAESSALPITSGNGFFPGGIKLTGPEANAEATLEYAETAMRRAQSVGVELFVLGSGTARAIPDDFDREKAESQFIGLCRKLGELGAKYNVVVVIEPLNKAETNYINTVREGTELVRKVNHPNFRVLADFYHMSKENEGAEAIVEAGDALRHCHIAEGERRTRPGAKGDDFTPYFKALKEINYQGNISIECSWSDFKNELPLAIKETKRQIHLSESGAKEQ